MDKKEKPGYSQYPGHKPKPSAVRVEVEAMSVSLPHIAHRRQELGRLLLVVTNQKDMELCKREIGHRLDLMLKPQTTDNSLLWKWIFSYYDLVLFHHPQRIPAIPHVANRLRPVWFLNAETFVEAKAIGYDLNRWLTSWINRIWEGWHK